MQRDDTIIDAPEVLAEIDDNIVEFNITDKE